MESGTACHISVAGNVDPERHLPEALERLRSRVNLLALSTFYRTAALERPEQPDYLNGVALVRFRGDARTLKFDVLRGIEAELGRVRGTDRHAARSVDLDLLLFGDLVVDENGLTLPDPDLWQRPFVAAAVLELSPDLVVPGTQTPLRALADMDAAAKLEAAREFTRTVMERFAP